MMEYFEEFFKVLNGSINWTLKSVLFDVPWNENYFWGLIVISIAVWGLEILFPWRKEQKLLRKDFWLDGFYMFFNFFIFSFTISGFYHVLQLFFSDVGISEKSLAIIHIAFWPMWLQCLVFFIVLDFVQWITHILLHRIPVLWQFHKVHHSVKEMGFAAHLRYHWMENILYKPLKTFGVMILGGFEPEQAYVVHFIAITIGHLNHSNMKISWGPLKYVLNNPIMHLYHHAYAIPEKRFGINFGISLSVWDYLFKTNHIPETEGKVKLGFPGDEDIPSDFLSQLTYGFKSNRKVKKK